MRRRGFTLVEVLISVVLIDVGLLALVASGSVLVRRSAESRLRSLALRAAADRIALLAATPCAASAGSTSDPQGIAERWTASSPTNGVRELQDSVTFIVGSVERSVALRTAQSC